MGGRGNSSGMSGGTSLETIGQRQLNNMTDKQRESFDFYDFNGQVMNDYLRGGRDYTTYGSDFAKQVVDNTRELNNALNNASLPVDVEAYRGVDINEVRNVFGIPSGRRINPRSLIGRTYSNRGFLSSTTDMDYASNYADPWGGGNPDGALLHINFKKGAKAVYESSGYEDQILGAHRSKFKVTNAYYDRGGMLHVHMTGGK